MTVSTDISLVIPKDAESARVEYSVTLYKDGKAISQLAPGPWYREAGGWLYETPIPIPDSAAPGVYVIKQTVSIKQRVIVGPYSSDGREINFTVAG